MMATNVATALEIDGDDHIRPVTWDEWIRLPVRPQDNAVQTVRGQIRVPTVIVAVNYAKAPKKRLGHCGGELRQGAEEAPEAVREDDPGTRRQPLPVHGRDAEAGRRQPRPRCAPFARRQGRVGKPSLVEQGREHEEG